MTPLFNYSFIKQFVHKVSKNRHHIWPVKINWWKHFRKIEIAVCLFDRALFPRSRAQSRDGSRCGREGSCGTILRSLKGNYSNVSKIWTTRIYAHETCPSVALNNEELNKVWQIKTKEKNISENIPFDHYCTMWRVLLGAVQLICFVVICLLVWKCYKRKSFRKPCLKICYVSDPVSARRWDFRPDNQLSGVVSHVLLINHVLFCDWFKILWTKIGRENTDDPCRMRIQQIRALSTKSKNSAHQCHRFLQRADTIWHISSPWKPQKFKIVK